MTSRSITFRHSPRTQAHQQTAHCGLLCHPAALLSAIALQLQRRYSPNGGGIYIKQSYTTLPDPWKLSRSDRLTFAEAPRLVDTILRLDCPGNKFRLQSYRRPTSPSLQSPSDGQFDGQHRRLYLEEMSALKDRRSGHAQQHTNETDAVNLKHGKQSTASYGCLQNARLLISKLPLAVVVISA